MIAALSLSVFARLCSVIAALPLCVIARLCSVIAALPLVSLLGYVL